MNVQHLLILWVGGECFSSGTIAHRLACCLIDVDLLKGRREALKSRGKEVESWLEIDLTESQPAGNKLKREGA